MNTATATREKLRITKITIQNIGGINEFEVEPGQLTVIEGGNAAGKSSMIKALKTLIGGGAEAKLKVGSEEARGVLVFSDGTTVSATNSGSGWRKKVIPADSGDKKKPLSKPQEFLDGLTDALGFNPVAFANGRPKELISWLLEMLPVAVTEAEIEEAATGEEKPNGSARRLRGAEALERIDRTREAIYDARTGVNRLAKEKRATADESYRTVPKQAEVPPDPQQARADRDALADDRRARLDDIGRRFAAGRAAIEKIAANQKAEVTAKANEEIERIRTEARAKTEAIEAGVRAAVRDLDAEEIRERSAIAADLDPLIQGLDAELAGAEERIRLLAGQAQIRAMAKRADEDAEKLECESRAQTEAIYRLDALRAGLLKHLPVAGLEVRDGALFLDGVPFEDVNTAKKIIVGMEIAAERLKGSPLALMAFDGLEALDRNTFAEFVEYLRDRPDLQVFGARVDNEGGELRATAVL